MKTTRMLLPRSFKVAGLCLFAVGAILGVLYCLLPDSLQLTLNDLRGLFGAEPLPTKTDFSGSFNAGSDLTLTFIGVLMVVAGVFIGFSRNKDEDEFIEQIRYESLQLSVYLSEQHRVGCMSDICLGAVVLASDVLQPFLVALFLYHLFLYPCFNQQKNDAK